MEGEARIHVASTTDSRKGERVTVEMLSTSGVGGHAVWDKDSGKGERGNGHCGGDTLRKEGATWLELRAAGKGKETLWWGHTVGRGSHMAWALGGREGERDTVGGRSHVAWVSGGGKGEGVTVGGGSHVAWALITMAW